jgi:hypothetical protein
VFDEECINNIHSLLPKRHIKSHESTGAYIQSVEEAEKAAVARAAARRRLGAPAVVKAKG